MLIGQLEGGFTWRASMGTTSCRCVGFRMTDARALCPVHRPDTATRRPWHNRWPLSELSAALVGSACCEVTSAEAVAHHIRDLNRKFDSVASMLRFCGFPLGSDGDSTSSTETLLSDLPGLEATEPLILFR